MSWVGVAVGVGTAAANIYSGNKAADAAKQGSQQSADVQRYMYDTTRSDTARSRHYGDRANDALARLMGLPQYVSPTAALAAPPGAPPRPTGSGLVGRAAQASWDNKYGSADPNAPVEGEYIPATPDYSGFYNSPDYKFAYDEGMRATEQEIARRGLSGSGPALKALARFGQGIASQQLNNYRSSLMALAGHGQSATQQLGSLGVATGQGMGNAMQSAGDARASSYLNTGSALSQLANNYGQYRLIQGAKPTNAAMTGQYLNFNQGLA